MADIEKLVLPEIDQTDRMKYPYFSEGAIRGIKLIESLPKHNVMGAMKGSNNVYFGAIFEAMGPKTNPNWICGRCVERAQDMGWIDDDEADKLMARYS